PERSDGEAFASRDAESGTEEHRDRDDAEDQRQLVVGTEQFDGEILHRCADSIDELRTHRRDQRRIVGADDPTTSSPEPRATAAATSPQMAARPLEARTGPVRSSTASASVPTS